MTLLQPFTPLILQEKTLVLPGCPIYALRLRLSTRRATAATTVLSLTTLTTVLTPVPLESLGRAADASFTQRRTAYIISLARSLSRLSALYDSFGSPLEGDQHQFARFRLWPWAIR